MSWLHLAGQHFTGHGLSIGMSGEATSCLSSVRSHNTVNVSFVQRNVANFMTDDLPWRRSNKLQQHGGPTSRTSTMTDAYIGG